MSCGSLHRKPKPMNNLYIVSPTLSIPHVVSPTALSPCSDLLPPNRFDREFSRLDQSSITHRSDSCLSSSVSTAKLRTPLLRESTAPFSAAHIPTGELRRLPPVLGCLLGGMIVVLCIMGMVKPPDHNLAVRAHTLEAESRRVAQKNRDLEGLIRELRARQEKVRANLSPSADPADPALQAGAEIRKRLQELEQAVQRATDEKRDAFGAQGGGTVRQMDIGSVVHATQHFLVGNSVIVKKGAPGVIVEAYRAGWADGQKVPRISGGGAEAGGSAAGGGDPHVRRWVVQFSGVFGPSRPVRMTATAQEIE